MIIDLIDIFKEKREEIGTKALAEALDISDSAVRMICSGHYPNQTNVFAKFERVFMTAIECPYSEERIELDSCKQRSTAPRPFGSAAKLAWWEACQICHKKPELK